MSQPPPEGRVKKEKAKEVRVESLYSVKRKNLSFWGKSERTEMGAREAEKERDLGREKEEKMEADLGRTQPGIVGVAGG